MTAITLQYGQQSENPISIPSITYMNESGMNVVWIDIFEVYSPYFNYQLTYAKTGTERTHFGLHGKCIEFRFFSGNLSADCCKSLLYSGVTDFNI